MDNFGDFRLFDQVIPSSTEVKYLGVIIDSKLQWKQHARYCTLKSTRALMACRSVIGKNWGLRPAALLWIYRLIVLPMLSYGCLVWWHRLEVKSYVKIFSRVQRLACLMSTGAMRSTPTLGMELILGIIPVDIHIHSLAIKDYFRIKTIGQWKGTLTDVGHQAISGASDVLPLLDQPSDLLPKETTAGPSWTTIYPERSQWIDGSCSSIDPLDICCFTDGSRMETPSGVSTGSGIVIGNNRISTNLGRFTSVFQAEIFAISMCVHCLLEKGVRGKGISICSDSQASLMALDSHLIVSKLVKYCISLLHDLCQTNVVKLVWVPGHADIEGNELADLLARAGSLRPFIGPEPVIGIPKASVFLSIKNWVDGMFASRWDEEVGCRQTKLFLPSSKKKWSSFLLKLNKSRLRQCVQVLTGHSALGYHLHKMGLSDSPDCSVCNVRESAEHFLCSCTIWCDLRLRIFGSKYVAITDIDKVTKLVRFVVESEKLL